MTYKEFELTVQNFAKSDDFKENKSKLKELMISSYDTFIKVLKLGAEITQGIRVCEEIFDLSRMTALSENEILDISNRFRLINALIDEKHF